MSLRFIKPAASSVRWLAINSRLTDSERGKLTAPKFRRVIEAWEFLKSCKDWVTVYELAEACDMNKRTARRMAHMLKETGLVDVIIPKAGDGVTVLRVTRRKRSGR